MMLSLSRWSSQPAGEPAVWSERARERFVWDGWDVVAEYDARAANALRAAHVWSPESRGTGGVGALLATSLWTGAHTGRHVPAYDASGNVRRYTKASDGALSAAWTYGPFGETLAQTGPATGELMYRFSTKPADPDTGHVRYQLRTYAPATGRWLSRDPIEEEGGLNVYGFVGNRPVGTWDWLGMAETGAETIPFILGRATEGLDYLNSEIIIQLIWMHSSSMDWAGAEMLRHLFIADGALMLRHDDPRWSSYMRSSEALTSSLQAFWRQKFLKVKREHPRSDWVQIPINERIPVVLGRNGMRDFTGHGLLNGSNPGLDIEGILEVDQCNRFSGEFRYTFLDRADANWGVEADKLFFAFAWWQSFGNAREFDVSISWRSGFFFKFQPHEEIGWPFKRR